MSTPRHLDLDGHRLVAAVVSDGAVREWECRTCGRRAEDAFDYVSVACDDG